MPKKNKGLFSEVFKDIARAVNDLGLENLPEVGKMISERIVMKARMGKTMASGSEAAIKPLSKDYVEFRESIMSGVRTGAKRIRKADKKAGGDGKGAAKKAKSKVVDAQFFKPSRSNQTLTGQFLKSIDVTKIDGKTSTITIGPTDKEPRKKGPQYVKVKGGKTPTNREIATYQEAQGRSIWGLDDTGRKRVRTMVKAEIRRMIQKNKLRKK